MVIDMLPPDFSEPPKSPDLAGAAIARLQALGYPAEKLHKIGFIPPGQSLEQHIESKLHLKDPVDRLHTKAQDTLNADLDTPLLAAQIKNSNLSHLLSIDEVTTLRREAVTDEINQSLMLQKIAAAAQPELRKIIEEIIQQSDFAPESPEAYALSHELPFILPNDPVGELALPIPSTVKTATSRTWIFINNDTSGNKQINTRLISQIITTPRLLKYFLAHTVAETQSNYFANVLGSLKQLELRAQTAEKQRTVRLNNQLHLRFKKLLLETVQNEKQLPITKVTTEANPPSEHATLHFGKSPVSDRLQVYFWWDEFDSQTETPNRTPYALAIDTDPKRPALLIGEPERYNRETQRYEPIPLDIGIDSNILKRFVGEWLQFISPNQFAHLAPEQQSVLEANLQKITAQTRLADFLTQVNNYMPRAKATTEYVLGVTSDRDNLIPPANPDLN